MTLEKTSRIGAGVLVAAVFAAAIIIVIGINAIRFGGEMDLENERIAAFEASINPPSAYLLEPFMEVNLMANNPDNIDEHIQYLQRQKEQWIAATDSWAESELEESLKTELAQTTKTHGRAFWAKVENELIPAIRRGNTEQTRRLVRETLMIYRDHRGVIDTLVSNARARRQAIAEKSSSTLSLTYAILAAVGLALLGIVAAGITLLNRRVIKPIYETARTMEGLAGGNLEIGRTSNHSDDEIGAMTRAIETFREALRKDRLRSEEQSLVVQTLSEGLDKLSQGDFSHRIGDILKGEHVRLRDAFNSSVDRLSRIIVDVRSSAAAVNTGSSEILSASEDTAQRNEQQAASLEETAASMREVTDLVKRTASSAQDAKGAMTATNTKANDGGEVVRRAVKAMASIEDSSSEITQIIDVIDGIAFQTNLLALNAGVEAARAGDAGKGFAVVANEVRALAQRSAEAAQNIKQLISTSTGHVAEGVDLVDRTGELLGAIVEQLDAVSSQVDEIAAMAAQQASSLEHVNSAVESIDSMTQQNAAMVEETTAASRSLSNEAERLSQLVAQFQISEVRDRSQPPANSLATQMVGSRAAMAARAASPSSRSAQSVKSHSAAAPPVATAGNLALKPNPVAAPEVEDDDQDWSEF